MNLTFTGEWPWMKHCLKTTYPKVAEKLVLDSLELLLKDPASHAQ
jgi:hypothetical protein